MPGFVGLIRMGTRAKAAWAEILSPAHPCLEEFPAALAPAEYPVFAAEYPVLVFLARVTWLTPCPTKRAGSVIVPSTHLSFPAIAARFARTRWRGMTIGKWRGTRLLYALILDAADLSTTASTSDTPHSPQRKMFRSVRPPGCGEMRARCIDRPQFGQSGPALIGLPAGRGKFCMLNMVLSHARFAARSQTPD
jgi:hypothetical protein